MGRRRKLGRQFKIDSAFVTLKFRSQKYATPNFNPRVESYILQLQVPLANFDTGFFFNPQAAVVLFEVSEILYIARVGTFKAEVEPELVTLNIEIVNIQPKEAWDLEHSTPRTFYNDLLRNKKFFIRKGRGLDMLISPLGLSRKRNESDTSFRRRVIEYLQFKIGESIPEDEFDRLIRPDRS